MKRRRKLAAAVKNRDVRGVAKHVTQGVKEIIRDKRTFVGADKNG